VSAPRIVVVYYSASGTIHALAESLAAGAQEEGAEVRLRRVEELAPPESIAANPSWQRHTESVASKIPVATQDDMVWGNGYAFGTPTRFGNVSAQVKQFMDSLGGLWAGGDLANKPVTSFTSAMNPHGGQESTILALNNTFYHWGSVIVPPGYTNPVVFDAGGNPYGASWATGSSGDTPGAAALAVARYQGGRLAAVTRALQTGGFLD